MLRWLRDRRRSQSPPWEIRRVRIISDMGLGGVYARLGWRFGGLVNNASGGVGFRICSGSDGRISEAFCGRLRPVFAFGYAVARRCASRPRNGWRLTNHEEREPTRLRLWLRRGKRGDLLQVSARSDWSARCCEGDCDGRYAPSQWVMVSSDGTCGWILVHGGLGEIAARLRLRLRRGKAVAGAPLQIR